MSKLSNIGRDEVEGHTPTTGPEIIDKMAAAPSLDRFFTSKPPFTEIELRDFIAKSHAERALWELKQR